VPSRPRGVASRLFAALFLMAAVPLAVFLVFDALHLGQRLLGGLAGEDAANAALALAAAAAVAVLLARVFARSITRPLGRLAAAATELSRGEAPERLSVEGDGELSQLAGAFNTMADRLTGTISDLNGKLQGLSTELFYLSSLGTTLSEGSDPVGDLGRLAPRLRTMFASDFAWLFLVGDKGVHLVAFDGDAGARNTVAVGELAGAAVNDRKPMDGGFSSLRGRLTTAARAAWAPVASAIAAPLVQQGEAVGVIVVGSLHAHHFADEKRLLLSSVATQVAFMLAFADVFGQVEDGYLHTVTVLCGSLEEKDRYPRSHPEALAHHAVAVGRRLRMSDKELRQLHYCALLHDVGKADVPGAVLDSAGTLSDDDVALIKRHTVTAERLIRDIPYLEPVAGLVRSCHERWDGLGYPDGLREDQIPLASRIVFVCDAFEALTHDRPYREALSIDQALTELRDNAGTQFDSLVVHEFVSLSGLTPSADAPAHELAPPVRTVAQPGETPAS